MNCFDATYRPVAGGYHAMVRLPRHAAPKPILAKGGKPKIYESALAAQKAATASLLAYINGDLRRDGEKLLATHKKAEALFKKRRPAHA